MGLMLQDKLAAAHEKLERLELERADAARLAALRGRAGDAQSAALRAAEAALARKRGALVEALSAREAAEAALAQSQAQLQSNGGKVRADSPPHYRPRWPLLCAQLLCHCTPSCGAHRAAMRDN